LQIIGIAGTQFFLALPVANKQSQGTEEMRLSAVYKLTGS